MRVRSLYLSKRLLSLSLITAAAGLIWVTWGGGQDGLRVTAMSGQAITAAGERAGEPRVDEHVAPTASATIPASGAASAEPENPTARERGWSRGQTGWRLVGAGQYMQAREAFREATTLVPDDPRLLVGLGLTEHRLRQDDKARPVLERAIKLEPSVGLAHKLLGDIAYGAERFEDAVQHYAVAMRQDPNDAAVQDGFFAARQALHAQWASDRLFSPHFMVQYPGAAHRPAAQAVTEVLEAAYREVGEKLSAYPPEPVMVILYERGQFQEAVGAPHWADGLFDGKIHVSLAGVSRGSPAFRATLAHEYTHALVHRLSDGHAPTWLNEGLALVVESEVRGSSDDELARYAGDLMPLSSLHGVFVDLSPAAARIAYAESRAATRALIQRFGLRRLRQLLEDLATEPDFDRAFAKALATSYREFDRTWLAAQTGVKL